MTVQSQKFVHALSEVSFHVANLGKFVIQEFFTTQFPLLQDQFKILHEKTKQANLIAHSD